MAAVAIPEDNGFAERLMRMTPKMEVGLSEHTDFHDACEQIGCYLKNVYTRKSIHSAFDYLAPTEFEVQWFAQQRT